MSTYSTALLWDNPWASTAGGRLVIWQSTLQVLPGRLLAGLGPAGCALVYPYCVPPWLIDFATNPHNAFLQLWADAGALDALAGLYVLVAGLCLALLVRRLPREHAHFRLSAGLLGAIVGAAVHGTFESAISAVVLDPSGAYHYIVSPLPWYVAGLLWIVLSTEARPRRGPVAATASLRVFGHRLLAPWPPVRAPRSASPRQAQAAPESQAVARKMTKAG